MTDEHTPDEPRDDDRPPTDDPAARSGGERPASAVDGTADGSSPARAAAAGGSASTGADRPAPTQDGPVLPGGDRSHLDRGDLPSRRVVSDDRMRQLSRRSLLTGVVGAAAGFAAFRALTIGDEVGGAPRALRAGYEVNEDVWSTLTDLDRLAPEFDFAESAMPIVNGRRGIEEDVDVDEWTLTVTGPDGARLAELGIDEIRAMPFTETIFEFKCIEGWSEVTAFGGVRVSDFVEVVAPDVGGWTDVGMTCESGDYYVSVDRQSLMHPQTLLAWEMQRAPLTQGHGAPLRLCTPLKYGIKNIRRPSTFAFATEPQPDFWGERGYSDWVGL